MIPFEMPFRYSDSSLVKSLAWNKLEIYIILVDLTESINLIDWVEKDKHLGFDFVSWAVKLLEYFLYHVLMKLLFSSLNDSVVIIYTCQSDSFIIFSMRGVLVGLKVTCVFFVKVNELFVHCGWTCDQVRVHSASNDLQNFSQGVFIKVINIINLINGDEMTITQIHVPPAVPVQKGLGLADDNVTGSVSLAIESSKLKIKFLRLCLFSEFDEFFQNVLNLFLENVVLQEDDSLRLEDFVLDKFASAEIR